MNENDKTFKRLHTLSTLKKYFFYRNEIFIVCRIVGKKI